MTFKQTLKRVLPEAVVRKIQSRRRNLLPSEGIAPAAAKNATKKFNPRNWVAIRDPSAIDADDLYLACEYLISDGNFVAAERLLTKALDRYPGRIQSRYLLGITLLLQDRFAEARAVIDGAYARKTWLSDFRIEVFDITPHLRRALETFPDWEWPRYMLERERFFGIGLTFRNVVREALAHDDVTFVEIGANDGVRGDALRPNATKYGWRGLLVEPLPEVFKRLQENYKDYDKVEFANVAIGERDERRPIFLDPQDRNTLASFVPDRNVLSKKGDVESIEVECVTFATLFKRYEVDRVDVLQTDTEGYDYQVLKSFDFASYHPKLINLEYYCLPIAERIAVCDLLRANGYAWRFHRMDLLAVDLATFGESFHIIERG